MIAISRTRDPFSFKSPEESPLRSIAVRVIVIAVLRVAIVSPVVIVAVMVVISAIPITAFAVIGGLLLIISVLRIFVHRAAPASQKQKR